MLYKFLYFFRLVSFLELLQNSRLPPVPEEGADEMIKNVDYGFSSIMGKYLIK